MDDDDTIGSLSFEDALRQLETIVNQLETGELPLDHAIEAYERGNRLRQRCEDRLNQAQARIEAIRLDADRRPVGLQPFDAG